MFFGLNVLFVFLMLSYSLSISAKNNTPQPEISKEIPIDFNCQERSLGGITTCNLNKREIVIPVGHMLKARTIEIETDIDYYDHNRYAIIVSSKRFIYFNDQYSEPTKFYKKNEYFHLNSDGLNENIHDLRLRSETINLSLNLPAINACTHEVKVKEIIKASLYSNVLPLAELKIRRFKNPIKEIEIIDCPTKIMSQ